MVPARSACTEAIRTRQNTPPSSRNNDADTTTSRSSADRRARTSSARPDATRPANNNSTDARLPRRTPGSRATCRCVRPARRTSGRPRSCCPSLFGWHRPRSARHRMPFQTANGSGFPSGARARNPAPSTAGRRRAGAATTRPLAGCVQRLRCDPEFQLVWPRTRSARRRPRQPGWFRCRHLGSFLESASAIRLSAFARLSPLTVSTQNFPTQRS